MGSLWGLWGGVEGLLGIMGGDSWVIGVYGNPMGLLWGLWCGIGGLVGIVGGDIGVNGNPMGALWGLWGDAGGLLGAMGGTLGSLGCRVPNWVTMGDIGVTPRTHWRHLGALGSLGTQWGHRGVYGEALGGS